MQPVRSARWSWSLVLATVTRRHTRPWWPSWCRQHLNTSALTNAYVVLHYVQQGHHVMPGVSLSLSVCLFVCLFVCLLATLRKNYRTDLRKNFTTDVSVHKEELVKFWKSFASGSRSRNFSKDSSTLQDSAFFHNLAYISRGSDRIFVNILSQMYRILGQGSSH